MTLIIGIKCKDGVVMASDGAATMGSFGQRTITQPIRKLCKVSDELVLATSGGVGLQQKYAQELKAMWQERALSGKTPLEATGILRDRLWKHTYPELQMASAAKNAYGPQLANETLCVAIVAVVVSGKPVLLQFNAQCSSEEATDDLPFIALGSGQALADPFLGFLRKIFWEDDLPSLHSGVFVAIWTLEHAIGLNTGGIAEPKQVMMIDKVGKNWKARELSTEEIEEHVQHVHDAEKHLRGFRHHHDGSPAVEVPKPEAKPS